MKKIVAMILAGGRVNELGVLTLYRPKSAVPFGGIYRVIDFPLSNLMHSGISKIGILSQYRSTSLINHIGVGEAWDFVGRNRGASILPPFKGEMDADWYLGTADAVYQNLNFIYDHNPDLVLILSGDHIYKMDYQPLIKYHLDQQADLTAVFKRVPAGEASRFGLARFAEENDFGGPLKAYDEKPAKVTSQWASLTIYLFNTRVLIEVLKENHEHAQSFHIGKDIIPAMINRYRVFGYKFYGYWGYTQTIDEYYQTNMDILDKPSEFPLRNWEVRTNLCHRDIRDRMPAKITPTAKVTHSLIYNGCTIAGEVHHSLLFPGVKVEPGAVIRDSIVMFDTVIQKGARVSQGIIGSDVLIREQVTIGDDSSEPYETSDLISSNSGISVVGERTQLPPSLSIGKSCTIYPFLTENRFSNSHIRSGMIIQ